MDALQQLIENVLNLIGIPSQFRAVIGIILALLVLINPYIPRIVSFFRGRQAKSAPAQQTMAAVGAPPLGAVPPANAATAVPWQTGIPMPQTSAQPYPATPAPMTVPRGMPPAYLPAPPAPTPHKRGVRYRALAILAGIGFVMSVVFWVLPTDDPNSATAIVAGFLILIDFLIALVALVWSVVIVIQLRRWGWLFGLILGTIGLALFGVPTLVLLAFGMWGPTERRAKKSAPGSAQPQVPQYAYAAVPAGPVQNAGYQYPAGPGYPQMPAANPGYISPPSVPGYPPATYGSPAYPSVPLNLPGYASPAYPSVPLNPPGYAYPAPSGPGYPPMPAAASPYPQTPPGYPPALYGSPAGPSMPAGGTPTPSPPGQAWHQPPASGPAPYAPYHPTPPPPASPQTQQASEADPAGGRDNPSTP